MQVQAANRRAMQKYQNLHTALDVVRASLEESEKLHKRIDEGASADDRWRLPNGEDIAARHEKAVRQVHALHAEMVKWEKELVSKGWRV